jgi:hypothetical protein
MAGRPLHCVPCSTISFLCLLDLNLTPVVKYKTHKKSSTNKIAVPLSLRHFLIQIFFSLFFSSVLNPDFVSALLFRIGALPTPELTST